MRFDGNVYYHGMEQNYPFDVMVDEWREQARFMDAAGFTTCWLGEQHFWWDDRPVTASPNAILTGADLVNHTKRLRIAQSACVLPDWNPLRCAEDLALLDHIAKGRLDVGFARGNNNLTNTQLNRFGDRRNSKENWQVFKESVEIILAAWTQETFSYQGEYYTVPTPGWKTPDIEQAEKYPHAYRPDGEMIALGVMPKPYQQPHPPVWQAADSTDSYRFAAEYGFGVLAFGRSIAGLREAWTAYQEVASARAGRAVPFGRTADGRTLGVMRLMHIADTQEEAETACREGINLYFKHLSGANPNWARKGYLASDQELTDEDANLDWFDFLQKHEATLIGSPEYVAERIERLRTEIDCDHFTVWPNPVFISFKDVMHSFDLFASRVMPYFNRDGGGSA